MKKLEEVASSHGWALNKKAQSWQHKEFNGVNLDFGKTGWRMRFTKDDRKPEHGNDSRSLLKFLTKFHQSTLPLEAPKTAKIVAPLKPAATKAPKVIEDGPKANPEDKTPRIVDGWFLQGLAKFKIDTDDLFKTCSAGGFGPGQVHERHGILLTLSDEVIKNWAVANNLTVEPFARELLITVLRGVLQDAWFRVCYDSATHPGLVDNPERRADNHARNVAAFDERLKIYTGQQLARAEKARANLSKPRADGSGKRAFAPSTVTWKAGPKLGKDVIKEAGGQQKPILEWLLKNQGTKQAIADAVSAHLKTKQAPALVVGHYLPEWKKKGWVTEVETKA